MIACEGNPYNAPFHDGAKRRRQPVLTSSVCGCSGLAGKSRGAVLCKRTKWADRLSKDLHGAAPVDSNAEDVDSGLLLRDNASFRSGKPSGALASSFPAITQRSIALPLDYYQVLGADTHFLADAIVRTYESRVNNPPSDGFSQETLASRQEILRGASDTLSDPELRGEYNASLIHDAAEAVMIDVPLSKWRKHPKYPGASIGVLTEHVLRLYHQGEFTSVVWGKSKSVTEDMVPGALCILQEVGEMEIVLQVGRELLREHLSKSFQRDIVLAMALAYVELSREAMAESPPGIVQSNEMLERALKLLQDEGGSSLVPSLQDQIDNTLQQMKPPCILELLALPLSKEHKEKREEGLQGIRSILWAVREGGAFVPMPGYSREEFMKEAFAHMTSEEQMALFTATPTNIPAESSEVYAVALAHVAQGFSMKKPHCIQEADTLFVQLHQTNEPSMPNHQLDFAFVRGMCALLLGELDDCRAWLGLDDTDSPYRDPSVADFVFAHSFGRDDDDFLPGLCKLLESWLKEVVFPSFRDTKDVQVKLTDYYDDSGVLNYLEKLEKGGSPLAAAAAIVQLGAGAGAALDNVKISALETLQKVFPLGKVRGNSELENKINQKSQSVDGDYAHIQQHRKTFYNSINNDASLNEHFAGPASDLLDGREARGNLTGTGPGVSHLFPLVGVAIGVAVALGGWKIYALRSQGATLVSSPISGDVSGVEEVAPKMDAQLAEHLVQNWQTVKALALGLDHLVGKLPEVLDGHMLKSWTERAKDVTKNRWYYEYKLKNLSIESVTLSTDGRRAVVEATLQEAACMYDEGKWEITDSYETTYITRYEFRFVDGLWKISSGAVLHPL